MTFIETPLPGAYVVDIAPSRDERGFFARTWCREEFGARGLDAAIEQCSVSFNPARATLRGLHYQAAPHMETKVVRCTRGALYDVIVDLRRESPSFCQWFGIELTAENRRMLYVPKGLAHGFLTLRADTEAHYYISGRYVPDAARGVRWDDPAFNINWPLPVEVIAERDRRYPAFTADIPR